MNRDVVQVQIRAVLPLEGSFTLFLGTEEKTFVIYVDENVGTAISLFMRGVPKERPLTHDLFRHVLMAFGARVERVVINRVEGSVFYARLILSAENELQHRKLVELDARPSDGIALAVASGAPIFVATEVWENVEDVSATLEEIEAQGSSANLPSPFATDEEDDEDLLDPDDDEEDDEFLGLDDELFGTLDEQDEEDDDFDPLSEDDDEEDDDEGEHWKQG
ncbi:MAG: bifunctional nuclease family protein [Verrucomicrobiales bacterium]|nr:bifunctional nuclease family protein [Verrucomicrobiales bacterium]